MAQAHHRGGFVGRARRVREAAYADPGTRCWRCGLTLAEIRGLHPGRRVVWHAGHTVDGSNAAPLMPEHSYCNVVAGNLARRADRVFEAGLLNSSRRWY